MKRKKGYLTRNALLMAASLAFLAGCGGKGDGSSAELPQRAGVEDLGIYYSVEEESFLNPLDLLPLETGEFGERDSAFLTKEYIVYHTYTNDQTYDNLKNYLGIYDRQLKSWNILDKQGERTSAYEGELYRIAVHTAPCRGLDEKVYQVVFQENKSYLAEINGGKISRLVMELTDKDATLYAYADLYKYVDREGRLYLADNDNLRLYCYDENKTVKETEVPGMVYGILQKKEGEDVCWYGLDAEKNPVVKKVSDGKTVAENLKGIGTEYQAVMAEDGSIYFADTQNLWKYTDGTLQKIFAFVQNDYLLQKVWSMECTEQGDLELLVKMDSELVALTMHREDSLPRKKEIVLADDTMSLPMKKLIARFNRQNKEYYVTYRVPEEGQESADFRQAVNLELSNGKGPDMLSSGLILSPEDYVEKGYLASVDALIADPEQFGSGVLEDQKIGDTLYGIPYQCSFFLAAYSTGETGDRTAITLPEFMELVENSDADVIEENMGGVDILVYYVLHDNDDATYIDWKEGKSYLDGEEFRKALEFAKKYADSDNTDKKAFAQSTGIFDLFFIKDMYSYFQGSASLIGFPCKDGNGIYVRTDALYKNAATGNGEGVDAFLRFLISEREQERYAMYGTTEMTQDGYTSGTTGAFPVLKDAYRKKVTKTVREDYKNSFYISDISYTDEMVDWVYFMRDHAKPDDANVYAVYRIIMEELNPYFDGSISAQEAAERLQNRVQLYLNERQNEEKTDGQYKDEQYEITMDEVKKLSAKKDLSLTDLYAYSDRKETEQGFAYYAFSYDGVEYALDIYTTEQGELEGARLVRRSDYLSIDIRNGNIDHLLTSDVSVADYLTVELPQKMAVGAYDMYMPDFGGSRIDTEETKNEEISCGKIRLMHGDTPVFADGKLTDIAFNDNNLYAVTKESISDLPVPCLFMELTEDGDTETEWWAAYFTKEGVSDIGYLVQLKKDCFTKEEALDAVKSVQFTERAFGME